jgi:membrane protein implicated in regulation of membrane protease activity
VSHEPTRTTFREKLKRLPPRMYLALACYIILVAVGLYVLLPARSREEQILLALFLAVFALMAVKTVVHSNKDS